MTTDASMDSINPAFGGSYYFTIICVPNSGLWAVTPSFLAEAVGNSLAYRQKMTSFVGSGVEVNRYLLIARHAPFMYVSL